MWLYKLANKWLEIIWQNSLNTPEIEEALDNIKNKTTKDILEKNINIEKGTTIFLSLIIAYQFFANDPINYEKVEPVFKQTVHKFHNYIKDILEDIKD